MRLKKRSIFVLADIFDLKAIFTNCKPRPFACFVIDQDDLWELHPVLS